jgi:hypothetical protein
LTLLLAIAIVTVCVLTLEASANGAGGGGAAPCVVTTPGRGAIPIFAVAAITIPDAYPPFPDNSVPPALLLSPATVDLTLRVWKPSLHLPLVFQAFRLELQSVVITDFLSNEALACLFLDPGAPGNPHFDAVNGFVQAIARFLGIPPVTRFVITSKSIRNTEPVPSHDQQVCTAVESDPATRLPRCVPVGPGIGSTSASSIADIVFYTK